MDQRLMGVHILAGSLNPDSFSEEERQFLAKHLGKKKAPEYEGGPGASVGFAMEWAEGASKEEVEYAKAQMSPSAPLAEAGEGGGKSAPTRKTKKKTTKKKR